MLYVFDGFELKGTVEPATLRWNRKFNQVGDFELQIPFTPEHMKLLVCGRILYKKNTCEGAFILNRNIFTDSRGTEKLVVRGAFLSEMLSRRIASYGGTVSPVTALEAMVQQNMVAATNPRRNVPGLVVHPLGISLPAESVKMENQEILSAAVELCAEKNLGFRVGFDPRKPEMSFELYQGRERSEVIFSRQFGNVKEQEYYEQTDKEKTTVFVNNNGSITTVGDQSAGLQRKEAFTSYSSEGGSPETQGEAFLKDCRQIKSMDTVIDTTSPQFEYRKDWDLGDVVNCRNADWDVVIRRNILEIEEYYDKEGKHLTVVFGDYIPTWKGR